MFNRKKLKICEKVCSLMRTADAIHNKAYYQYQLFAELHSIPDQTIEGYKKYIQEAAEHNFQQAQLFINQAVELDQQ